MDIEPTVLAYLAGAMDSDGYFSIKKSTYHMRVRGDATNATYSEKIGLHQVTPQIPELLKACFGGALYLGKPQTPNSKAMYRWACTDTQAAVACAALLPYLRVKRQQAERLLELRESKGGHYGQYSYWFAQEHPDWLTLPLLTYQEAAELMGYKSVSMVTQAVKNGTLLALPYDHQGKYHVLPRIPRLLIEQIRENLARDGRARNQPPQLVAWRERLWGDVREMNKIGIDGTPIYHRTGHYALAE